MKARTAKWLVYSLGAVTVALWFYAQSLNYDFVFKQTSPDADAKRTVAYEVKGKTVYLTQEELGQYHFYLYLSLGLLAAYIPIYLAAKKKIEGGKGLHS